MPEPTDTIWPFALPLRLAPENSAMLSLAHALPNSDERPLFEDFIRQRFHLVHGADIRHFMPELFGLKDQNNSLCAVAGLRRASTSRLFLEQYLDAPIEHYIPSENEQPTQRECIVEVGNLAASDTGSARLSIITMTWLLGAAGFQWVSFTGSTGLVNSFHRLGLKPTTLCAADPQRLGDERHTWGQYYDSRPSVHIGNICSGFQHLAKVGLFKRLGLPPVDRETCNVA